MKLVARVRMNVGTGSELCGLTLGSEWAGCAAPGMVIWKNVNLTKAIIDVNPFVVGARHKGLQMM